MGPHTGAQLERTLPRTRLDFEFWADGLELVAGEGEVRPVLLQHEVQEELILKHVDDVVLRVEVGTEPAGGTLHVGFVTTGWGSSRTTP